MFTVINSMKRLVAGIRSSKWFLASAAAVAFALPAVASADRNDRSDPRPAEHREIEYREPDRREVDHRDLDRHDFDRRDDRGIEHRGGLDIDLRLGDRRPAFEGRQERVWVAPVYRTVCETQWVAPVYQTVCEQVLVPDRFEDRQVQYQDHGRLCTRIDHVLVEPAHYETRNRQVCVTEGHNVTVERQELVAEGHYEFRAERVAGLDVHFGR